MRSIPEFTRRTTTPVLIRASTSPRFSFAIGENANIAADTMNSVTEMKCKTIRMMCSSKKFRVGKEWRIIFYAPFSFG